LKSYLRSLRFNNVSIINIKVRSYTAIANKRQPFEADGTHDLSKGFNMFLDHAERF
jgi:hypothetical protein